MSNTDNDRRRFERVPFHNRAEVTLPENGNTFETELLDISMKGVLLKLPEASKVNPESSVNVFIPLGDDVQRGDDDQQTGPSIELTGLVAHIEEDTFGVTWTSIDTESMSHLRRLLEFNLADEKEIRRELSELSR